MREILIHSPFPLETSQGNTITAVRLKRILMQHDISVRMSAVDYDGAESPCMVALNAWRSAEVVSQYKAVNPEGVLIIIITGSDINNEEMADENSATRRSMMMADALVMLHDIEFEKLPLALQQKCTVIYPSVTLPDGVTHQPPQDKSFQAIIAGNLRPVKNPYLAIEACRLLNPHDEIQVTSYGAAEGEMAERVTSASVELHNYHWHGKVTHIELLEAMSHSHVLLNVSIGEGGANAICEAITMGLPVIASDIRGNKGMLGDDYVGLYPSEDAAALARMLKHAAEDPVFYQDLQHDVAERAELFSYEVESRKWIDLIDNFY